MRGVPSLAHMSSLPVDIEQGETLLRSLKKHDVNIAANKPKARAFKPSAGDPSNVSLIRQRIGSDASKDAAVEHVHGDDYWGFAKARHEDLQPHCVSIQDDRDAFLGHAGMALGYEVPKGPPHTPADQTDAYDEAMEGLQRITEVVTVVADQYPGDAGWSKENDPLEA